MKPRTPIKNLLCAALLCSCTLLTARAADDKKPSKEKNPPYTAINMSRYESKAHARIKEIDASVRLSDQQKESILHIMRGYYGHKLTPQEIAQRDTAIARILTPSQQTAYQHMQQQEAAKERRKETEKRARQKRQKAEKEKQEQEKTKE